MFKVLIIEDDALAREMLNDLLVDHHPEYTLIGFFDTVKTALKSLPALRPDLIFLDMELPDGKGFDILEKLVNIDFEVIVTTSHDSYMLQAIKHSALDYLLKPVDAKSLADALHRFEMKIASSKSNAKSIEKAHVHKIILPMSEGLMLLDIPDIIRLESDGSYTIFFTRDGKRHVTSQTLATYEPQLSNHSFFRVHHSHLINLNHISKYVKGEGGYVIMSDGTSVDVSRRKKEDFLRALGY